VPGAMLKKLAKRAAWVIGAGALTLLAVRVFDSQRGPTLEPWHTVVPKELTAEEIADIDWQRYLEAEDAAFDEVRARVTRRLDPKDRVPANRYFEDSPVYPGRFAKDWNRSFVLEPEGPSQGAVVLLHGLTDSPYSMRQVARRYRDRGFVAIVPRLPGHGTVPAGLSKVHWEDWAAATRLAVREAMRRAGAGRPLHVVGYSNGGALAVKYALDAIEDPGLPRPVRVVLISPMIGITEMARFAGFAGLPAIFPPFAKAAWLGIVPEFNPFKYNSFPVNGARQSSLLTRALQPRVARLGDRHRALRPPPRERERARALRLEPPHEVRTAVARRQGDPRRAAAAGCAAALSNDGPE
jgi:alpha-beta hydrolase superfamily lysophospholipase